MGAVPRLGRSLYSAGQLPKPLSSRLHEFPAHGLRIGLAHIGAGAFHRCHQAEYTEDMLAGGYDDRLELAVNIKPPSLTAQLGQQDCLYTRTLRSGAHQETRLIGSIAKTMDASDDMAGTVGALASPDIGSVTMTVTEKGYCHIPATGLLNEAHRDIQADLQSQPPGSLPAFLLAVLQERRRQGGGDVNLVSCDNIPSNGAVLSNVVLAFARMKAPSMVSWIEDHVAFPSTMVDRIVPAASGADLASIRGRFGIDDRAAVFGEPFKQWVLGGEFRGRRPAWDAVGAQYVADVKPFELIKMRVLNAAQTSMSLIGALLGHGFTFEAERDPLLHSFVRKMLTFETLPGLPAAPGMDHARYLDTSFQRLHNEAIRHSVHQIATDTSQKIAQRLLDPVRENLAAGRSIEMLSLPVAAWTAYIARSGLFHGGKWELQDALAPELSRLASNSGPDAISLTRAVLDMSNVFGLDLRQHPAFADAVTRHCLGLLAGDPRSYLASLPG